MPRGLGAVARAGHRAQPSDPPSRATEQAQPGVRTLAVPLPRKRRSAGASVSTRRSGRSVPAHSGAMAPVARGAVLPATPNLEQSAREVATPSHLCAGFSVSRRRVGCSNRRCRGWPITPEPAGPGRASRGGETAARPHANAEGPRRGSRSPVAGEGVCRRRARGRTSLQKATAAPAKQEEPHAVKDKRAAARTGHRD